MTTCYGRLHSSVINAATRSSSQLDFFLLFHERYSHTDGLGSIGYPYIVECIVNVLNVYHITLSPRRVIRVRDCTATFARELFSRSPRCDNSVHLCRMFAQNRDMGCVFCDVLFLSTRTGHDGSAHGEKVNTAR